MFRETILQQLQFTDYTMKANVGEITHEQSLIQPQPAGNCVNWILGHLVASRCTMLEVLGEAPFWSEDQSARYERHGVPMTDGRNAEPLDALWQAFDSGQERLLAAIAALPEANFADKVSFSPSNDPDETLGSLLATIAFHDAYHAGQTGVLRRIIGLPPADL